MFNTRKNDYFENFEYHNIQKIIKYDSNVLQNLGFYNNPSERIRCPSNKTRCFHVFLA